MACLAAFNAEVTREYSYIRGNRTRPGVSEWDAMQEQIGDTSKWPEWIAKLFEPKFKTEKRQMQITNFCFINGVNFERMHGVLKERLRKCYNDSCVQSMRSRYKALSDPVVGYVKRSEVYAYWIEQRGVYDLNYCLKTALARKLERGEERLAKFEAKRRMANFNVSR